MIEQAFEVATEFKFDIGQAMIGTKALQQGVDQLSNSSNAALQSLNFLASGLVAHLGFGSGGLLSVLTKSIQLSEENDRQALNFANTITSNMRVLTGTIDTFNNRLETSQMILDNISNVAIKFALPSAELANMSNLLATPLAQHNKLGKNFEGSIDMSKNLMLGAGANGINMQAAGESLYRALSDRMPLHGQLFARLQQTNAFKDAHVTQQQQLQVMDPSKKIDLLSKALKDLAMNSDAVNYRINSLKGQFTILQDLLSKLRPLGEALKKPLIMALKFINEYIQTNGDKIIKSLSGLVDMIFESPRKLFVNLLQLQRLGKDMKIALNLTSAYGLFRFIKWAATAVGFSFNGGLLLKFGEGLLWIGTFLYELVPWTSLFYGSLRLLSVAFAEVAVPFGIFLAMMQTISRARAIAKVNDAEKMLGLGARATKDVVDFWKVVSQLFAPVAMLMDSIANFIAPLFETSNYMEFILWLFEGFIDRLRSVAEMINMVSAAVAGLGKVVQGLGRFGSPTKNFNEGYDDYMKAQQQRMGKEGTDASPKSVINIGKQEFRFDLKEQLEPDRIAFAVTTHFKRLATNPLQGRGNTQAKAFMGSTAFAVNK